MKLKKIIIGFFPFFVTIGNANEVEYYLIPPSSTQIVSANNIISDDEMKQCVQLYNEALVIEKKLNSMMVNQYDSESVNSYNLIVTEYSRMIRSFNVKCAGKQSQSAYEQAQKLNAERQ